MNDLRRTPLNDIEKLNDCNAALEQLYLLLNQVVNKHAPIRKKRVKRQHKTDWLSPEIIESMHKRDKFHKCKDWENYRKWRNIVSEQISKSKEDYYKRAIRENQNTCNIWKYLNDLNGKKNTEPPPSLNYNDQTSSSPQNIANAFSDYFQSVYSKYQSDAPIFNSEQLKSKLKRRTENTDPFNIDIVTEHDVLKTLEKLNPNKSTGLDQIGPKILKLSAPLITRALTHIMNISIAMSEYPELLKKAKIIPVFKKGCKNKPENYRPISILPTLSKIFEKHVSSSIFEYLNKNSLIHKEQSGFRSQHSCQTALTKLTETWLDEINKGNLTGVVYLDFSKAFDLVNRQLLLSKLECYNFHHSAIEWISSYLSDITQQVTIGNKSSEQKPIPRGVPQGSVLGPLLFLIFINDLPMSTCESNIDLFADDSTLHNSGPSVQCVESNLRSDLKEVQDWCENNDMYINVDKTKTMLLTTSQRSTRLQKKELSLHIHETEIEQVSHHKLLGIHVDKFLHWDIQVKELFKRINSKINLLSKIKKYLNY